MTPARNCFWSPDFSWLSMLRAQPGASLSVTGAMLLGAADAANQSIAASAVSELTWNINTIVSGAWSAPTLSQAIVFESLRAGIQTSDANGQIQVLDLRMGLGDGATTVPIAGPAVLPFTLPAVTNHQTHWTCVMPIPLLVPRPTASANGPAVVMVLKNLDGAGAHIFRRVITFTYRIVDNVDFTLGPALPGAGTGL